MNERLRNRLQLGRHFSFKSVFSVGLLIFLNACSTHTTGRDNYFLAETSIALLFAYAGETFITDPEFRVYKLQTPLTPYLDFPEPVQLSAFADSQCKTLAPGTLTTHSNPLSFTQGIASFASASYAPTAVGTEELIYFSGAITADNFSTCGLSHSIIQRFNKGTGSIHFGYPGAAGAGTEATVLDQGIVQKITPTGDYIVAGTSKNAAAGTVLALWRYLPTGALDTSFQTTGYMTTTSPGVAGAGAGVESEIPVDLQIDSNGKYVIVGTSKNAIGGTEMALWRYNNDGTLDTTFGTAGVFHTGSPGLTGRNPASAIHDSPQAMAFDSNGNILVTGTSFNQSNGYELFVARLTSAGALDTTFGTSGVYTFRTTGAAGATGASEYDIGYGIQVAANGNYVVVGTSTYSGGGNELAIWKVSSSGLALDSSFGNSGVALSGTTGVALGTGAHLSDQGRSFQIDSSDKIVIVGSSENAAGGTEMAIWRYSSNGSLDTSFASSGALHFSSSAGAAGATGASENDVGLALAIDTRYDFYIVAGRSENADGGTQVALWRYTTSGKLDPTFNGTGSTVTSPLGTAGGQSAATVYDSCNSLTLDAYGTYIVAGSTLNGSNGTELALWRYLIVGLPDL